MRRFAFVMVCLATLGASASSVRSYAPDDLIENERTSSANGRFVVVVRVYPTIGDFESIRFADLQPGESAGDSVDVALYEIDGHLRTLVATFAIPWELRWTTLVTDSGQFMAAFSWPRVYEAWNPQDPILAVYRSDGTVVRIVPAGDVFTANDLSSIRLLNLSIGKTVRFDEEFRREVVTLMLPSTQNSDSDYLGWGEVRIDAATGAVLDPKRDIYPPLRVWATHSEGVVPRRVSWTGELCSANRDALRIASKQLLVRATARVMPEFPEIGKKAHIAGDVWVEVLVSESGEVVGTCLQGLPFGFDKAVEDAVRRWKFEPYVIDGQPVRVWSEIVFHFNRVEHAEWAEIAASPLQSAPP